nr:PREDICTED: uncharacterized protein LOC107127829 [Macaca fascicularis]
MPRSGARDPDEGRPFTPGVSRDPHFLPCPLPPPMGSTLLSPELPLFPSSHRLRRGCRPPERPRAAWAAVGGSCEAAGRGLGCGLLRRRAVSQKCSCPSPHTPLTPTARRTPAPSPPASLSSPRHPSRESGVWVHAELRGEPEKGQGPRVQTQPQRAYSEPPTIPQVRGPCPLPLGPRIGI